MHCLSIKNLTASDIYQILDQASQWVDDQNRLIPPQKILQGKTIANLFFEKSTRTRCSFELAASRLGAYVLNFDSAGSSTGKGETLLDTIDNLEAMGVDAFVMRHPETGTCQKVADHLDDRASIINAGDGSGEHPTQALLDMFTIRQFKPQFEHLSIAIVGDIAHSRVAHSAVDALKILGTKDIRLVGPPILLPDNQQQGVTHFDNLCEGIANVDVVMMLRIQKERMEGGIITDLGVYFDHYGLTEEKLAYAKKDVIVMHPGPMNRGVEIESKVAEGKHSVILLQAKFGVAVRMAVLTRVLDE